MVSNYHHYWVPDLYPCPKWKPLTISSYSSFPSLYPLAAPNLLSASMDLPIQGIYMELCNKRPFVSDCLHLA